MQPIFAEKVSPSFITFRGKVKYESLSVKLLFYMPKLQPMKKRKIAAHDFEANLEMLEIRFKMNNL